MCIGVLMDATSNGDTSGDTYASLDAHTLITTHCMGRMHELRTWNDVAIPNH